MRWLTPVLLLALAVQGRADTPVPAAYPGHPSFFVSDVKCDELPGPVKSCEETTYNFDNGTKGAMQNRTLKTYNPQGNLTGIDYKWFGKEAGELKSVRYYDAQGIFQKEENMGMDGALSSVLTETFDPAKKQMMTETKSADGEPRETTITTFDDPGRPIETDTFDGNGKLTFKSTMAWAADGRKTSLTIVSYEKDGQTTIMRTKWAADGSEIGEVSLPNSKRDDTNTTCDYRQRDGHGNWTVCVRRSSSDWRGNEIPGGGEYIERVITYY